MPPTEKTRQLHNFIVANLPRMERSGGSGGHPHFPTFELTARDYLQFAENELLGTSPQSRINCVSHLKRAAECQMDTFLHVCNLHAIVQRANLGFDAKLNFLHDIALFSSRSLARFNNIRNRIEHEYHNPQLADLEVFYDLVQAFVSVVESAILLFANSTETDYDIYPSPNNFSRRIGVFVIEYQADSPCIRTKWDIEHRTTQTSVVPTEREDFAFYFKVFVLLARRDCFRGDQFILAQLGGAG